MKIVLSRSMAMKQMRSVGRTLFICCRRGIDQSNRRGKHELGVSQRENPRPGRGILLEQKGHVLLHDRGKQVGMRTGVGGDIWRDGARTME